MSREPIIERPSTRHYAGIFLLSMATLLLELSLTRVLSVALWYHFGFLVISTALLGFGVSGVVVALWTKLREQIPLDTALAWITLLFGVLTILCFWLMQHVPFDPFSLFIDWRQWLFIPLYYVVLAVPFFCSGLALGLLFTRATARIHTLYAFDLVGAGAGCAAIALVMPRFGGSGSVVVAAALGMAAAAVFAFSGARKFVALALMLCAATFGLALYAERILPIAVTVLKVKPPFMPIYTAWNTFSRIDLFERPANPEQKTPAMRRFVFDLGTAATGMHDLRPGVDEYLAHHKDDTDYDSGIAYIGKQHPSVLVIGSGGGSQVLDALHFGASEITAVEVNPIITDVVSRRMNDFWGGLFNHPRVRLVTAEGRNFVRRSLEHFDAIISVHTISNAAVASGALALSENYVLTREAFEDYLDHLSSDGVIYFTRPEAQIARLFATAREALSKRGVQDFRSHFYAYHLPPDEREKKAFGANRPSFDAGLLVKKSPFTADEVHQIENLLGVGQPPRDASEPAPEVLYSPFLAAQPSIYQTLLTTSNLQEVYRSGVRQIEPATDDRPFFNHNTRWSGLTREVVGEIFSQKRMGQMLLGDRPIAEVSLLVLLAQSIVIAAILILLPLARWSRVGLSAPSRWRFLIYFAALGFGFIAIEMALLSQFALFLGQPVYTYAVVLASLLVFTGIGSSLAGRFGGDPRRGLSRVIPLILLTLAATALLIPSIFFLALGLPLAVRVVLSVAVLAPLGILLGMPFPTGLRIVSDEASILVPWAWGVNGFFTVIGTVLALILGMSLGFRFVLLVGGCSYLAALVAITKRSRRDSKPAVSKLFPATALLQVCLIVFGVAAPSLLAQPSQDVPACCRRDGKHHCAMHVAATENGPTVQSQAPDCPYRSQASQTNRTQGIPLQHVVSVFLRTEVLESAPSIFEACHRVTRTTGRSPPSFLL